MTLKTYLKIQAPSGRAGRAPLRATGSISRWVVLVLACIGASCAPDFRTAAIREWTSPIPFDSSHVIILTGSDTIHLGVELATSPEQRAYGLMLRPLLAPDRGMIFAFPEIQDPDQGFWMFRTRMPLDIAFYDEQQRVVAILAMPPCENPNPVFCQSYAPGIPYIGALEVNQGYLASKGVGLGAEIIIDPQPTDVR